MDGEVDSGCVHDNTVVMLDRLSFSFIIKLPTYSRCEHLATASTYKEGALRVAVSSGPP